MKKRLGLTRALPQISREQLERMATGALLARLKRLRWCEESRECSDLSDQEVASTRSFILFKDDPAWGLAYADVRGVLATRDNVPNKP